MTDAVRYGYLETPVGPLLVAGSAAGLRRIAFARDGLPAPPDAPDWLESLDGLRPAVEQLAAYFAGGRRRFALRLDPRGTPFQLEVWHAVATIPFGETRTYGEIAGELGRPGASRAVGAANGANPLPLVVPCHRVIGADGSLTGFGGGLPTKRALLAHEGVAGFSGGLFD